MTLKEECDKVDTFKEKGIIDQHQSKNEFVQKINTFSNVLSLKKELNNLF